MELESMTAEESAAVGAAAPAEAGTKPAETPEPKPENATEPAPKGEEAKGEAKKPVAQVPIHALHEAREKNKLLTAELAELRKQLQPKPAAEIDVDKDPVAALKATRDELRQRSEQEARQRQEAEFHARLTSSYRDAAQSFMQETPDFREAYDGLLAARVGELQAMGYSQAEAARLTEAEERNLVIKAFQDGVNPAERLYAYAQARGFKPKAAAANAKAAEEAAAKLKKVEEGQAAAKSLGAAPGSAEQELSLKAYLEMSDDEADKLPKDKLRKLLGG